MAEDSEHEASDAPTAATTLAPTVPRKKLPKGLVLGPDGKPCRACSSLVAWQSQSKSLVKNAPSPTTTAKTAAATTAVTATPNDCPADVETLGRSSWTLLHTIAASYPKEPTPGQQDDLVSFMRLFSKLYPCWVCAEDFQAYMKKEPVQARTRDEFGNWLCEAHNNVNKKLGKPVFDCALWKERWKTGWKDGRCD